MNDTPDNDVQLRDLEQEAATPRTADEPGNDDAGDGGGDHTAADVEVLFDVPVKVSAVLGRTQMEVSELLKVDKGAVISLDRKVGEAIDIFVNNRLVARGEVVLVDDKLGVTMTEIIKSERG